MKLEAKSMWLLSFAWRNRNLKQKQKRKRGRSVREKEAEGKQTPSHTAEHHPFFSTCWLNTNRYLCTANTSSTTGQSLIKVHLQGGRNNRTLSPFWGLLAVLQPPCVAHPVSFTWYAPCTRLTPLWSCSQGYGAMIILPLTNLPLPL